MRTDWLKYPYYTLPDPNLVVSDFTQTAGMAGIGTSGYIATQFDNFNVNGSPSATFGGSQTMGGKLSH